jgi:hypothetical protein
MSDFSRISRARDAALTLLDTLNPEDFVGVVLFDSTPLTPSGCFSTKLAVANPYNINLLKAFVTKSYQPGGSTIYGLAFQAALAMRDNGPPASQGLVTVRDFLWFLQVVSFFYFCIRPYCF